MTRKEHSIYYKLERELGSKRMKFLEYRNFTADPRELINLPVSKLCQWNFKSINAQTSFKHRVGKVFFSGFETIDTYFSNEDLFEKIKFNVTSIDEVLEGGIEVSAVTEIYGEAGSGKTQLCFQIAFNCRLPQELGGNDGKIIYLTTDKPACARRLRQIDKAFREKYGDIDFLGGIFISQFNKSTDFEEFIMDCLPKICEHNRVKIFIIDSIAGIYRIEHDYINRAKLFCKFFQHLEMLAAKHKFAIFLTNHVTTAIDQAGHGAEKPALGVTWSSLVTCRINIKKLEVTSAKKIDDHEEFSKVRKFQIEFSPRLPPKTAKFIITSRGIEDDENANNLS